MTGNDNRTPAPGGAGGSGPEESGEDRPFRFSDKRKIDPETGEVRASASDGHPDGDSAPPGAGPGGASSEADLDPLAGLDFEPSGGAATDAAVLTAQAEAAEHLDALQRERASFVNYRNRALRDQEAARARGIEDVLTGLLPVLDDIDRARQHGELTGPFAAISDKLDGSLAKFGIERYGQIGEEFDPEIHDALMHATDPAATSSTINIVIEPGYRIGEKVVRAARVSVVGPE